MRLFSKKTRERNKKTIFIAPKVHRVLFVCASYFYKLSYFTREPNKGHQPRITRSKRFGLLMYGLLFVFVFSLYVHADTNSDFFRKKDTINVFPGHVSSINWTNEKASLTQDVNQNGLFLEFTTNNSAHLLPPIQNVTVPQRQNSIPEETGIVPTVETRQPLNTNDVPSSEIPIPDEILQSVDTSDKPTDIQMSDPVVPPTPDKTETTLPEQVSLNGVLDGVFGLFKSVTALLPFAIESVTTQTNDAPAVPSLQESFLDNSTNVVSDEISPDVSIDNLMVPENLSNLETIEANASGTPEESGVSSSEVIQEPVVSDLITQPTVSSVEQITQPNSSQIEFGDFAIPALDSGQFITNIQLRMSMAAQNTSDGTPSALDVEFSFGDTWENAGSIMITDEVSNALNGGYFLFALPEIQKSDELNNLKVRITYHGTTVQAQNVYLDAVWLEVHTETFDRESFKKRLLPEALPFLTSPEKNELISENLDFSRSENPLFTLRYLPQRNLLIRMIRSIFSDSLAQIDSVEIVKKGIGVTDISPQIDITVDGLWTLQLSDVEREKLTPGTYTINVAINEGGKQFLDSFDFQWGLLAINPNQTEYEVGDTATITIGALSPNGNTLCQADIRLYLIDSLDFIYPVPVQASELCNGNTVIDEPDYVAQFVPSLPGVYEMYVERVDENGNTISHTSDTFIVVPQHTFTLKRNGFTRINPREVYSMELVVTSRDIFSGTLSERIPLDFEVTNTNATIDDSTGEHVLTWDLNLQSGIPESFSYSFDAPDISPLLFTLGPAEISANNQIISFDGDLSTPSLESFTQASITSTDEAVFLSDQLITTTDASTSPTPSLQTEESLVTEVVPVENIVQEVSAEPKVLAPSPDESLVPPQIETQASEGFFPQNASTTFTDTNTSSTSISNQQIANTSIGFIEHRQWQIASDATGSMIVFWTDGASVPAGWTCLSCGSGTFYQRFPVGGATYNTTGGSTTHTHTATGAVNATTLANSENSGSNSSVAIVSHTHTYAPTIASTTTLPAYRQLRAIQYNSAGTPASIPAGAILMFDGTIPSGWSRYTALDARYPYGENTITSGGSNTHTHSINDSVDAAGGSKVASRSGGPQVTVADATHTHTVSTTTPAQSQEPPFIEVLFATSSSATATPATAIAMWTDTPPAGWLNKSAGSSDPFYDKFIKGSATYGTTGGNTTHTPSDMSNINTSAAVGTTNARSGSTGAQSTHTHAVDITAFSSASNTPPYITVIFGKYFGLVPLYTQSSYRWYANTDSSTPIDPWPVGAIDVAQDEAIDSSFTSVKNGDIVRLRMQLSVTNATSTGEAFKLQYGTTTSVCTTISSWTDVGGLASSTEWIAYDNTSVSDGATLASSTLTGTDALESYEETNPTVSLPNQIGVDKKGEWDFVIKQNNASGGTTFCFRMVESSGTLLNTYTQYPKLVTNQAPLPPTLSKLFDNEKVASTTPWFEFLSSDSESNDLTYQIQIDDDYAFASVNIDRNTESHASQFENLVTPSDKDPYTSGELIRFKPNTALTNGITYYWHVRAKDPTGSNGWGTWSTIYSFTVDTATTITTWFQTTEEQFDTGLLVGTDAISTDLVQLASGSTTGTTTSSQLDFMKGSTGNAWGSLSWTDNETVGDIKYKIQYYDTNSSSWSLVPDTVLSGNSTGFDASPISLLSLDVETYRLIRVLGVFTNSGGSPTLSDWTIAWGNRVLTPTVTSPFNNEKVGTTAPSFIFSTTDPQSDDLVYQIQWSTSSAFTASTTRSSDVSAGFVNLTNGGDASPFFSGDTIKFTIQSADILTNNTTYWWRVRARDPLGDNQYSFYAGPYSFTVDSLVTVSTWFQTTAEQFDTDILSGTLSLPSTENVSIATTSSKSIIGYAEGTVTTPRYREWNGTSWGTEASALDVSAPINWVVTKSAPNRIEYLIGTLGTDGDVNIQAFKNGAWGNLKEVTTSVSDVAMRGFDIAYEQVSEDALVVTCDGDADPSYYTWNGTSWSSVGNVGLSATNACGWIRLISNPTSDEIIAITRDTTGTTYEARVWNGTSWGNSTTWGSMSEPLHEGLAAEYEESGNQAVVAVSNGNFNRFTWRAWNGTSWTAAATVNIGNDFEFGSMTRDSGTDNMAICYINNDNDVGAVRWDGSAWTGQTTFISVGKTNDDRVTDCIFEVGGTRDGYIMVAYTDATNVRYQYWNGTTWSTQASVSTIQDSRTLQLRRTGANLLQLIAHDDTNDRYDYSGWNGTSWSTFQTLETDAAVNASPFKEAFMIAPQNPATIGTVIPLPSLDFNQGSGPYWSQMTWNDSETGGSSLLYQIEYYNTASSSWQLVSNSLIPGNSAGTTTGPIILSTLLPASTYRYIRPVGTFTCNSGTCPTLNDWTITWSAGITISGTAQQYNQSTNVTSGTVAVAINGVLQTGKTGVISGGTWSIANVNVAAGDIVTIFVTGSADTNEAIGITRYDGSGDIDGMTLFERHLSLGSNDATTTPITNTDIGYHDFTNSEDLFFNVTGTSLNVCADAGCDDAELYIKSGVLYQPNGSVITHDTENNGTLSLGGNTITVSGSWDNNGTTTSATSTVIFTATSTTETIDETGAISPTFNNIIFGTTTTATAVWNLVTPLTLNGNLTVSRGTLGRNTQLISLAGSLITGTNGLWSGVGTTTFTGATLSNWSDNNATLQNVGNVLIDGTSKTVTLIGNVLANSLTIGADDIFDVSTTNYNITVLTHWTNQNTFVARSGTVYFAATTSNNFITANSNSFYNMSFTGTGGSWSFTEPTLTVGNNFTIATGTVTMPTATTTITGSFLNTGGTFAHNNATVLLNTTGIKTIQTNGTDFTNAFYNLQFSGSGSWSFIDTNATTSNNFTISQGTVTMPSGTLTVEGSFTNTAGTFVHNSGTVQLSSGGATSVRANAPFNNVLITGAGTKTLVNTNVTALGNLTVTSGGLVLPTGTLTLGGSLINTGTLTHSSGTVLFSATATGKTIDLGNSSLYNVTINGAAGGWTIGTSATTTNNFTLAALSSFALASGQTLSVGGTFTNSVNEASTTWTGSTLSLESGSYSLNTKTNSGDVYDTLRIQAGTNIKMWNSSATTYTIDSTGSLYSQDHNDVDGDLYIFGSYARTGGSEYWNSGTDFDGATLATSSRQVDVRFAGGASATFASTTVNIVGTSTATTTIANQGSGTYTIQIANGTTTMNYYDFSNLGSSGITLTGTPAVPSLSDGRIVPDTNLGSGLTVSSSTIDANPGLQIYRVEFSTTTAISAYNVTQNGGAPVSYWWFRESSGNLDGELFDNDTGDPGSIRWDDSALTITVSGTIYGSDELSTLGGPTCGAGTPVRIVVSGGGTYDGGCDGSGYYSLPGVVIVGDPTLTVFLNGSAGGERAVTVTKTPTADITNLDLMVNHVIVRHEDVSALTIANMALYDSSDDSDILFTAATGTPDSLLINPNTELYISATTTFTPGGSVTLVSGGTGTSYDGSLHIAHGATFTGTGTSTYSIGGSFTEDNGATFIPASSTVLMTATTSGKAITPASGGTLAFNELQFTGVGGAWNINGNILATGNIYLATGTVTGTGNITLSNGSLYGNGLLSLGSGTTTIEKTNTLGGTQAWTFGNLILGNASVVGTTTPATNATTTILGKLTIATGHYFVAGGLALDLQGAGNVFVENGNFIESTSTVRYSGTTGSNILSTNYYNLIIHALGGSPTYTATGLGIVVLNNLTVGGTGTTTADFTTNDPSLDVNGSVSIETKGTLIGSNSAAFSVGGSWDNNGTFTGSGGTLTFDSAGTKAIAAGASPFSNVVISGAGDFTISEHATTTSAFTLTNATNFTVGSGVSLAIGGTFTNAVGGAATTWTGSTLALFSGTNYSTNGTTTSDTYDTLFIGSNTDVRMWNSSASTYTVDSTGSLYSQDHAGVNGALYIFGNYPGSGSIDYWNYARDFDGTSLAGSERKVDVYFAGGASFDLTSGQLSVLGAPSASTTIQNQGSGTYRFNIGGTASTTWSYYEVRNTDSSGITFSGTPTIGTLSHGDYIVSQNGGSAITVDGTVITQNPAKTFTGNIFATTTGISGFNVTATGTTVSSWRFTNHSGNIAGEAYDVDPDGDPGYIVWDNSAASITISGNIYSDEGTTASGICDGSTPNVHLRVAGLTTYTTSCTGGSGAYTISGITYSPGDSLIVYIDGEAVKGVTVTEDPISNISDMDIYENRVIVRHEGVDSLSIADMAVWDSSDDADIPFTAVDGGTDTLALPANRKLIIWTAKTFKPMGNVTIAGGGAGAAYDGTLELYSDAVFDATGSEVHTVGGSLILGSGASLDSETSTFTFTTSGAGRTIQTNNDPFYNITFNGSGSWTSTDSTFSSGNDFTLTQGTVTLPTGTTTIAGAFLNTGGSFNQNGGQMVFTASVAKTIRVNGSDFGTTTFAGSGSWTYLDTNATSTGDFIISSGSVTAASGTLALGGNFINNGIFTHNNGTLGMTSGTPTTSITTGGSDLGSVTLSGASDFIFTDTNLALLGTLQINQGTATLATGTMSIAGSFLNNGGSFNHASGTILFNASSVGKTINPGNSPFNIVTIAAPSGGYTITGNATTTSNFTLSSATSFTLASSTTLRIDGVFSNLVGGAATTWTGSTLSIHSGVPYTINTRAVGGDVYNLLMIDNNTSLRMWNSSATTTILDTTSSLYSQDNANVDGELYIFGNYTRTTGTEYWSYVTDFDGTSLTGGGERVVTARIANGATTTFSGGTLRIVGTALATTTVTNQGSGTYSVNVVGGTLYALNYAFRNMDSSGLSLLGTTTISSFSKGDFELAVNEGSLITLSSTTLNYNASLYISGMRFATTTAITGTNVSLLGSIPSAWTFTAHRGNLSGELFDSDGGSDCGSIRWDDSSCLLTQQTEYRWRNDDGGEGVPDTEWFDTDWSKRKRVGVTNADATTYADAVVNVVVPYDSDMQSDFDDLRFTDMGGTTTLSYVLESYTASTEAVAWVKVPTLTASSDTNIFMYYGNGAVADAGSGTTTFSVYDDFEDGNINEYGGDTTKFSAGTSFNYQGSQGLSAVVPSDRTTTGIYRTDVTVAQGETIRFFEYIDTTAGSGDETCTLFGVQTPGSSKNNYGVCLEQYGVDRVSIVKDAYDNDTNATMLASTTISYTTGWYEIEVDWKTDNSIFVSVYRDGTLVATSTANDSSYTSGGIGFTYWFQNGGWDIYSSRPLITTKPTITLGYEQVHGGATWMASRNTKASGAIIGSIIRPRFIIENTGLSVDDQYKLEYAPRGGSPSCESVSASAYAPVPPQSSCGTSAVCMVSSSQFSNEASTTDVLGGQGTFTPGQIIEDPSNSTQSITVDSNEYTEVEYALISTENVTDSNYCFRVSDAGTSLDSYTRIAELELLFAPNITSLSLNGGVDISLLPGATTTIYATGTVSDMNGYSDLALATTSIYRSGVTDACTPDANNCYIAGPSQCSFVSCVDNSCNVVCSADFYFHADPTDSGSTHDAETWRATLEVSDYGGSVASGTAPSIDLLTLRAITVDSTIDYGALQVNSDTGSYNATTTISNIGNDALDISVEGTDLSDGGTSRIPVQEQKFATSTFDYGACVYCSQLATTSLSYELDLPKPASTTPAVFDQVFWGIAVPFGVAGDAHTGVNTFYAIGD